MYRSTSCRRCRVSRCLQSACATSNQSSSMSRAMKSLSAPRSATAIAEHCCVSRNSRPPYRSVRVSCSPAPPTSYTASTRRSQSMSCATSLRADASFSKRKSGVRSSTVSRTASARSDSAVCPATADDSRTISESAGAPSGAYSCSSSTSSSGATNTCRANSMCAFASSTRQMSLARFSAYSGAASSPAWWSTPTSHGARCIAARTSRGMPPSAAAMRRSTPRYASVPPLAAYTRAGSATILRLSSSTPGSSDTPQRRRKYAAPGPKSTYVKMSPNCGAPRSAGGIK